MTLVVIFLLNYELLRDGPPFFHTLSCPKTPMLLGCTKGVRTRFLGKRIRVQAKGNFYMIVRLAYAHDAHILR